jgi:hypothetical protein
MYFQQIGIPPILLSGFDIAIKFDQRPLCLLYLRLDIPAFSVVLVSGPTLLRQHLPLCLRRDEMSSGRMARYRDWVMNFASNPAGIDWRLGSTYFSEYQPLPVYLDRLLMTDRRRRNHGQFLRLDSSRFVHPFQSPEKIISDPRRGYVGSTAVTSGFRRKGVR